MSEMALKMAEALRPSRSPADRGPEVSNTGTPGSTTYDDARSRGRASFGDFGGVAQQAQLHSIRAKHEQDHHQNIRDVFQAAVPAAVAQSHRWDNMATELRRACATMRDGLTQSLRDVEERSRVLEQSLPALEGELKEVRGKGNESLEYAEKFFEQMLAQVQAKKVQVLTELKEQISAKEWSLDQQIAAVKQHMEYLQDAYTEGKRVASIESELTLLECAGRTEALMAGAMTKDLPQLEPSAKAVFSSDVMPASHSMAIKAVPEFLTGSVVDWVAIGKDAAFQEKVKHLALPAAGYGSSPRF